MTLNPQVYKMSFGNLPLSIEIGTLAKRANGSALVRLGDTVVLSTAVMGQSAAQHHFLPLTVDFIQRPYAANRSDMGSSTDQGTWANRAALMARTIDRALRPCFPEDFFRQVQVVNTVFSEDLKLDPQLAALIGSSFALGISDIPFSGPVTGVRVAKLADQLILNPTNDQLAQASLDLTLAGTPEHLTMMEASAAQIPEDEMLKAIEMGTSAIQKIGEWQRQIIASVGQPKQPLSALQTDSDLQNEVEAAYGPRLRTLVKNPDATVRKTAIQALEAQAQAHFDTRYHDAPKKMKQVKPIINALIQKQFIQQILSDGIRPDGRKLDEIRPLSAAVHLLPRVHGSGLFTRGQTQVLSALTLTPLSPSQMASNPQGSSHFSHTYHFPPYSVGETGRIGKPKRREVGHGALGQKALRAILPSSAAFAYQIDLTAEVLSANGSSSQASICAGTLALLDGGVPIKAPVAGIAMGMVQDEKRQAILTDIQDAEDHLGVMDFKVAGSRQGITAIQLDTAGARLSQTVLTECLMQAKTARLKLLEIITQTMPRPRAHLSPEVTKPDL